MECKKCHIKKEITSFPIGRNVCIECVKKRKQLWYKRNRKKQIEHSHQYKLLHVNECKNYYTKRNKWMWENKKEYIKTANKKWYQENKEKALISSKKWRIKNPEKWKLCVQRVQAKLKRETLLAYSNGELKCACCGEKDIRFLTLDHINGGGNKERKRLKRSGFGFYVYLRKNGFPQNGYQVLCFNCNCAKRSYGICPHKISI